MSRLTTLVFVAVCLLGAATASAQVNLRWKFDRSEEYVVESVVDVEQTLEIAGMDVESTSRRTVRSSFRQGGRDGEGNAVVETAVESLKADTQLAPGLSFEFDSESDDEPKVDNPLLAPFVEAMKAVSKLDIRYTISPEGKVLAAEGAQNVLETASPELRQLLDQELNEKGLRTQLQQTIDALPDRDVKPGAFWDQSVAMPLGQGQMITFGRRYEYIGTIDEGGKTLHKVTVTDREVELTIDPGGGLPLTLVDSDLKIESSEGAMFIDSQRGRDVRSQLRTRITGSITFEANGQELPAQLDLTFDIHSKDVE